MGELCPAIRTLERTALLICHKEPLINAISVENVDTLKDHQIFFHFQFTLTNGALFLSQISWAKRHTVGIYFLFDDWVFISCISSLVVSSLVVDANGCKKGYAVDAISACCVCLGVCLCVCWPVCWGICPGVCLSVCLGVRFGVFAGSSWRGNLNNNVAN